MTDNYLVIRLCSTSAVDAIHSVFKGAGTCAGAVGAQRAGQTISSGKAHIDVVLSKAIFGGGPGATEAASCVPGPPGPVTRRQSSSGC